MSYRPVLASIYSGAGGLDIGFKQAGYKNILTTDNWQPACETLKKNKISQNIICDDIRNLDFKKILKENNLKQVDCLIGGPPCPPYSKSRFYLKDKKRALRDDEAYTLEEYFRAVEELKPKVFLFENVFGFVYKPHQDAFLFLQKRSEELGYNITYKVINCANYGVPQIRERFFCVGVKKGLTRFIFPEPTYTKPNHPVAGRKKWVTAGQTIGDLDAPMAEDAKMTAGSKHKDLLELVPPGNNYLFFTKEKGYPDPIFKWRSRYWSFLLKLSPDMPSWTIQASHSNNMGPFHWRNRFLRISEIKRLQTFPDDYQLAGEYKTQWRLIGNAVPPLMAKTLASALKTQYWP